MKRIVFLLSGFLFAALLSAQDLSKEQLLQLHLEMQKNDIARRTVEPILRENIPGARSIDVKYYDINLNIDVNTHILSGAVTMKAVSGVDSVSLLSIDLSSEFTVDSITGNVSGFAHEEDELTLQPDEALNMGDTLLCTIFYHGVPPSYNTGFFWANIEGHLLISTLSEPFFARTWWPCKDVPEDKADSVDIRVTINDTSMFCVSNGVLISEIDNGDGTRYFHWKERYPITTYLVSLAISDYYYWRTWYHTSNDSMPVDFWVIPEHRKAALQNFPKTPEMIAIYASLWGEYPFVNEKYAMAEFSWGGGMEHQTATSVGYSSYWGFGELLIAHELAHQWWGDMVTCANWHHIWVNEGFARYAEALYLEAKEGSSALHNYMANINRPQYWRNTSIFIEDTTSFNNIFDLLVYDKGAWVLHMLRHIIGDENYFETFHVYRENQYMDVATTEDFRDAAEEASGMDLDWFFNEWIYGVGQPLYTYSWTKSETGGNWQLNVTIHQDNNYGSQIFKMPVDIEVDFISGGDTTLTLMDSLQTQSFMIVLPDEPSSLVFDPENWILKSGAYFDACCENTDVPVGFHLTSYPNPFNSNTYIEYSLDTEGEISIELYDIGGRFIIELLHIKKSPGKYSFRWDGKVAGMDLPSGVYILAMKSEKRITTRKIAIIK